MSPYHDVRRVLREHETFSAANALAPLDFMPIIAFREPRALHVEWD